MDSDENGAYMHIAWRGYHSAIACLTAHLLDYVADVTDCHTAITVMTIAVMLTTTIS